MELASRVGAYYRELCRSAAADNVVSIQYLWGSPGYLGQLVLNKIGTSCLWGFHSRCSCGKLFVPILGCFLRIKPWSGIVGSCVHVFRDTAPCGSGVPGHLLAAELEHPLPSSPNPTSTQK